MACYSFKKYMILSYGNFQWKTWIKIPVEFTCLTALLSVVGNESTEQWNLVHSMDMPLYPPNLSRYPNVILCNSSFDFAGTWRMSSTHCRTNTVEEKMFPFEGSKRNILQYTCANLWEAWISPVKSGSRSQNPHAHTA